MRTEQCYCVLEVVKTGSFTKAAEKLYLKQPSLRNNIDKLEEELGQALFNRSKKGCTLTEFGEWCYPQIVSIIEVYEKMQRKSVPVNECEKPLKIGATRVFHELVGKSYNIYEDQTNGEKCIFINSNDTEDIEKKVINQYLDIGLISYFPIVQQEKAWVNAQLGRTFEMIDLGDYPVVALMRKNHPLATKNMLDVEALREQLLVFFNYASLDVLDAISHVLNKSKEELLVSRVTDEALLKKYLLEENAISFTLACSVESYSDAFTCVHMDNRFVHHLVALVPKGGMSENVKTYISIMKSLLL